MVEPGDQYSKLTVVSLVSTVKHGRNNVKKWRCRCECGRELEVDQGSLVKGCVPACKVCRRGPCVICGAKITDESFGVKRTTCSEICRKELLRRRSRRSYANQVAKDPEHNKKANQMRSERDPDYEQKRYARKKERINALPEAEKIAVKNKANRDSAEYAAIRIQKMKEADPKAYQDYLIRRRRSLREHYRRKALAMLINTADKLNEDENNE